MTTVVPQEVSRERQKRKASDWASYDEIVNTWIVATTDYFDSSLVKEGDELTDLVEFVQAQVSALPAQTDKRKVALVAYKASVFDRMEHVYDKPGESHFRQFHHKWLKLTHASIATLPPKVVKRQLPQRFSDEPGDSLPVSLLKFFKKTGLFITTFPTRIGNVFRKRKRPLPYWKHSVKLQGLFQLHFVVGLLRLWTSSNEKMQLVKSQMMSALKSWEEHHCLQKETMMPDFDEAWKKLTEEIKADLSEFFDEAQTKFETDRDVAGTWEYANSKLIQRSIEKDIEAATLQWSVTNRDWENTLHVLFEDWRSDLELDGIRYLVQSKGEALNAFFDEWLQTTSKDHLAEIIGFLQRTQSAFKEVKPAELAKLIGQASYQVKRELDAGKLHPLQEGFSNMIFPIASIGQNMRSTAGLNRLRVNMLLPNPRS